MCGLRLLTSMYKSVTIDRIALGSWQTCIHTFKMTTARSTSAAAGLLKMR